MKSGTAHCIIHSQRTPPLDTVNTFMFRAMIPVQPPDILHDTDTAHIENEYHYTDHTFNDRNQRRIPQVSVQQGCKIIRQYDKNPHRQHHRNAGDQSGHQLISRPAVFARVPLILFLVKRGRKIQALHTQNQRIYKIEHPSDKRKFLYLIPMQHPLEIVHLHGYSAVRPSHRYGILILVLHHNAFQNGLTSDPGIAFAFLLCHNILLNLSTAQLSTDHKDALLFSAVAQRLCTLVLSRSDLIKKKVEIPSTSTFPRSYLTPYFLLNFSIRPSALAVFCWPV